SVGSALTSGPTSVQRQTSGSRKRMFRSEKRYCRRASDYRIGPITRQGALVTISTPLIVELGADRSTLHAERTTPAWAPSHPVSTTPTPVKFFSCTRPQI